MGNKISADSVFVCVLILFMSKLIRDRLVETVRMRVSLTRQKKKKENSSLDFPQYPLEL